MPKYFILQECQVAQIWEYIVDAETEAYVLGFTTDIVPFPRITPVEFNTWNL